MESQHSSEESPLIEKSPDLSNGEDIALIAIGSGLAILIIIIVVIIIMRVMNSDASEEPEQTDMSGGDSSSQSSSAKSSLPDSYRGCYADKHDDRALPSRVGGDYDFFTKEECEKEARKKDARYYGLQWYEGSDDISDGQCWYGYAGARYDKHGSSSKCTDDSMSGYPGYPVGGSSTNAVYEITN